MNRKEVTEKVLSMINAANINGQIEYANDKATKYIQTIISEFPEMKGYLHEENKYETIWALMIRIFDKDMLEFIRHSDLLRWDGMLPMKDKVDGRYTGEIMRDRVPPVAIDRCDDDEYQVIYGEYAVRIAK